MKSILDPKFRYTSSALTDIRKTFARIRRARGIHQGREDETQDTCIPVAQEAPAEPSRVLDATRRIAERRKPIRERPADSPTARKAD